MAFGHWLHFLSKRHVVFNVARQRDGGSVVCWLAICLGVTYKTVLEWPVMAQAAKQHPSARQQACVSKCPLAAATNMAPSSSKNIDLRL